MTSKWLIGAVAALGLGVLTLPAFLNHDDEQVVTGGQCKAEGMAKLDLTMKDMNGKPFKLADQKGKVILLNFWATWCAPCRAEIPDFVSVYNENKDKGFVIIGVLTEDAPEAVPPFAAEMKMNYPLTINTPEMEDAYGPLIGLPASVLIARDGSVCKRHFGPMSKQMLEKEIKSLL
jgi:thiol-disulfide isomerase/thioredoxin